MGKKINKERFLSHRVMSMDELQELESKRRELIRTEQERFEVMRKLTQERKIARVRDNKMQEKKRAKQEKLNTELRRLYLKNCREERARLKLEFLETYGPKEWKRLDTITLVDDRDDWEVLDQAVRMFTQEI